jgi:hypothetical protein
VTSLTCRAGSKERDVSKYRTAGVVKFNACSGGKFGSRGGIAVIGQHPRRASGARTNGKHPTAMRDYPLAIGPISRIR